LRQIQEFKSFKKVELHRHLEGSVRLSSLLEMGRDAGVRFPPEVNDLETLKNHACVTKPVENLKAMLLKMDVMQSILATEKIIERVAFEACEDAFNEGIRILELRYSPGFIKIGHPQLTSQKIHDAIRGGVTRAEKLFKGKLAVGIIGIITRELSFAEAKSTTDFILENQNSFVGIDLAGDEAGVSALGFKNLFRNISDAGLGITIHGGEALFKESAQNVLESIEVLGARRIGHGIQIASDPNILKKVAMSGAVLEVCPTSNALTGAVASIKAHPVRKLLDAGVKVTINSDDPTFFGINLTSEYELLAREFNFSFHEFEQMNLVALKASFISPTKVAAAWKD
jgi:adenosine deaminase